MSSKTAKPQPAATSAKRLRALAAGLLLILLAFLVYRPAAAGPFTWDDNDYVWNNPTLRTPAGLAEIWFRPTASPQYYPLVFTTFWLEHHLWGNDPRPYREVNVLLHATSAILLWRLLRRLQIPGAFPAAAVFAVHPVMVESVAWITERKNTLSLVFYLAALHWMVRYYEEGAEARRHDGTKGDQLPSADGRLQIKNDAAPPFAIRNPQSAILLAFAFFLLALLSKTVTATLPGAMLVIRWWRRGRITLRDVLPLIPFFLLGLLAAFHTGYLERHHVGAMGSEWDLSLTQRILISGRVIWFYLGKLLLPVHLSFIYPRWTIDPHVPWQWLYPLALFVTLVALWLARRRIGRGPLAGALLFVGTLVPAMGFVNVYPMRYSFVADHFQYHAGIAVIVLAASGLTLVARRLHPRQDILRTGIAAFVLLAAAGMHRARVYSSLTALWEDARAKNPGSWMVHTQLGHIALSQLPPDLTGARGHYTTALSLAPHRYEPHLGLGSVLLVQEDFDNARRHLERALEIEPRNTGTWHLLGRVLKAQGQLDAAIEHFRQAISRSPEAPAIRLDLARALDQRGDLSGAIEQLEAALKSDPAAIPVLERLADALRRAQRLAESESTYRRLLDLSPDNADAHFNLAILLAMQNRQDAAVPHLNRALTLKPELRDRLPKQRPE